MPGEHLLDLLDVLFVPAVRVQLDFQLPFFREAEKRHAGFMNAYRQGFVGEQYIDAQGILGSKSHLNGSARLGLARNAEGERN